MPQSQDEITKVYEASVLVYIDSITASIKDFLEQFVENDWDMKFLAEWGTVLPNVDISPSQLHTDELSSMIYDSMNDEMLEVIAKDLLSAISGNSSVLARSTMSKVNSYVRQYDITTRGVDNYKVRYFMGVALLELLDANHPTYTTHPRILRAITNLIILNTMYQTFRLEEGAVMPEDMLKKFKICLLEGRGYGLNKLFGEYGLYLLFKTLSKALIQDKGSS